MLSLLLLRLPPCLAMLCKIASRIRTPDLPEPRMSGVTSTLAVQVGATTRMAREVLADEARRGGLDQGSPPLARVGVGAQAPPGPCRGPRNDPLEPVYCLWGVDGVVGSMCGVGRGAGEGGDRRERS